MRILGQMGIKLKRGKGKGGGCGYWRCVCPSGDVGLQHCTGLFIHWVGAAQETANRSFPGKRLRPISEFVLEEMRRVGGGLAGATSKSRNSGGGAGCRKQNHFSGTLRPPRSLPPEERPDGTETQSLKSMKHHVFIAVTWKHRNWVLNSS